MMTGTYTEIVQVVVPASAGTGAFVYVDVKVKNIHSAPIYITVTGSVDDSPIYFGSVYYEVAAGATLTFTDVFIMPNKSVRVYAWSFYWTADGKWSEADDSAEATVDLAVTAEREILEVDITPGVGGYVTTTPNPEGGYQEWVANSTGLFPHGTIVIVLAHPNPGYRFDHWSDEIVGDVSYQNPEYVQIMTEHRAVKAHFREEAVQEVETFEVDISPVGTGSVVTYPASQEGKTLWYHNETGTFPHGTNIQVTALPMSGYVFEKWSDQIAGGISFENPAYVQILDQRRTVKCHFRDIGEDPDVGLSILGLTLDGWGKAGALGTSLVTVSPGDTLQVQVTVRYTAVRDFTKEFWVSLVVDPFRDETFKHNISLPQTEVAIDKSFTFDIPISASDTLLKNQTYDLWVEFEGGLQDKAGGAVAISGMPEVTGILDILPSLIIVVVMAMVMGVIDVPFTRR